MRVLIVDDSVVFRSQLKNCLEGQLGIAVVNTAANGKIALDRIEQSACDLITLDLEMPEMNGMEFLAEKRRRGMPQRVIVFAAPTSEGAKQVLQALAAGADDFVSKPATATSLEEALAAIQKELLPKIAQFKRQHDSAQSESLQSKSSQSKSFAAPSVSEDFAPNAVAFSPVVLGSFRPSVVVIASSTGGPTALEQIFSVLNGRNVTVPILIAQHMPPHFTEALAKRLQTVSGIAAAEGRQGEEVIPGRIYVAPGDFHMSVTRLANSGKAIITLDQGPKRNSVRPAADCLFESAVRAYGGLVAGFVLTGMGEDGKDGAIAVKRAAGAIVIQDRASSVVWGMPGAVHAAGAFDGEGDLETCRDYLLKMVA